MIEVFKTDVTSPSLADLLVYEIHQAFPHYRANFDLHDCDHVLRVACSTGPVQAEGIIGLLQDHGFSAEPLPDDLPLPGGPTIELSSAELVLLGPFRGHPCPRYSRAAKPFIP